MDWAIKAEKKKTCLSENEIPKQYKELTKVFPEEKA